MQLHKIKIEEKKVLFVLTSHSELGTQEKNRVLDRRICSLLRVSKTKDKLISQLKGGQPNWSKSEDPSAATEDTKRFDKDTELKAKLKETQS
jgi:hypothetical protein